MTEPITLAPVEPAAIVNQSRYLIRDTDGEWHTVECKTPNELNGLTQPMMIGEDRKDYRLSEVAGIWELGK